ncbi:MAG: zinc ribbon domain-containing protein [Bacteroidales bacterium]|nr:zinc ribbon domain-containing protein [Bacteroidales bacterium]
MAISQKLLEAIITTMKTKGLTYAEKLKLIGELKKNGDEEEITAFINNAFNERLKNNYQKEELIRCPNCGELIPKDSDECFFCGTKRSNAVAEASEENKNGMSHSTKIAQLTALALKDAVLTFVERQTIVKAAMEEGIAEDEINAYLNKALEERMKSYSEEELTHCPCCGAQVPLISKECFYCGATINTSAHVPEEISISGAEADIIREENRKTADEHRNIHNCPDCGAPFPLISNICPNCGHILHEQSGSDLNIRILLDNINKSIDILKNTPRVTIIDVLKYRKLVVMFFIAALLLIMALSLMGYGNWTGLLGLASIVLLVIAFRKAKTKEVVIDKTNSQKLVVKNKIEEDSPAKRADETFYTALYNQEMYQRQISTLYGDNAEAKKVLAEFEKYVANLKRNRNKNRNILTIIVIVLTIAAILLPTFAPTEIENYQHNREMYPEIYNMSETRSTIAGNPSLNVDVLYSPYFSAAGYATLTFDVMRSEYTYINKGTDEQIFYKLRISGVKLTSTGLAMEKPDSVRLNIFLWDKDFKPVGKSLYPISIETIDYTNGCKDNVYSFLKRGFGSYYADFVSVDSTSNVQLLKDIANSTYYYTIY